MPRDIPGRSPKTRPSATPGENTPGAARIEHDKALAKVMLTLAGFVWGYALIWFLLNDRLKLLKIDQSDTRSLPKKRRRAMLDLTYRDSLLSLA